MIKETFLYISPNDSVDPYRNLAREEAFLQSLRPGQMILYLWQNRDTVVIGRNQNCYKECRVSLLEKEGGHLARRLSGGGAVFHDLKNLNYTFLCMREDYDVGRQTDVVLQAVKSLGIPAEATGRNDLTVVGRKFSGNAYYLTKGACYQHGTLLISVDEEKIGRYLSVDPEKLRLKGVDSVRSRVTGLSRIAPDLTVDKLREQLAVSFRQAYAGPGSSVEFQFLQEEPEETDALTERYGSPQWLYGNRMKDTYQMEKRFSWGKCELQLLVDKGVIRDAAVYTDALDTVFPETVANALKGERMEPSRIRERMLPLIKEEEFGNIVRDILEWIEESM